MTGLSYPYANRGIPGVGWETLLNGGYVLGIYCPPASVTCWPYIGYCTRAVLVLVGGTGDIFNGKTGLETYNLLKAVATAGRAAGAQPGVAASMKVIAATMPPMASASGHFTPAEETERLDYNARVMANAGGFFDGVVDIAAAPINDATSATYFQADHTHWTGGAAPSGVATAAPLIHDAIVAAAS